MNSLKRLRYEARYEDLFNAYMDIANAKILQDALSYMREKHDSCETPTRMEGIPYWIHPAEVWFSLRHINHSRNFILKEPQVFSVHAELAAILHDIDEDTSGTIEEIKQKFGATTAFIVSLLSHSTIKDYDNLPKEERRKIYWNRLKNVNHYDASSIKGLDRINNLVSVAALVMKEPKSYKKFAYRQTTEAKTFLLPIVRNPYIHGELLGVTHTLEHMLETFFPNIGG